MPNFTSGPWTAKKFDNSYIIENHEETYIADVHFWHEGADDITKANAHLVSAAPEMYAALEMIKEKFDVMFCGCEMDGDQQRHCDYHFDVSKEVDAALKKARGGK